jgi:hypothetical protein
MTRNTKGIPIPMALGRMKDDDPMSHMANCPDCMKTVSEHMGKGQPADNMESEESEPKSANYSRKRS